MWFYIQGKGGASKDIFATRRGGEILVLLGSNTLGSTNRDTHTLVCSHSLLLAVGWGVACRRTTFLQALPYQNNLGSLRPLDCSPGGTWEAVTRTSMTILNVSAREATDWCIGVPGHPTVLASHWTAGTTAHVINIGLCDHIFTTLLSNLSLEAVVGLGDSWIV